MFRPILRLRESLRHRPVPWALGLLLAVALGLRLYGIDWDRGLPWTPHPDERAILMRVQDAERGLGRPWEWGQLLNAETSPLNPHWFAYGSLPLYLLKGVSAFLSLFMGDLTHHDLALAGRGLSALFDVGTILLTFLLATRLYGRRVGLLAAAFITFAVLHIQLSHFYAVDTLLTFLILLALFFSARIARGDLGWNRVWAGLAVGLALATKVSALPILAPVAAAYLLSCFPQDRVSLAPVSWERVRKALAGLGLTLAVAGAAFLIAEPFALLDWRQFYHDTAEQAGMIRGSPIFLYTQQYIGTTPYLYPVGQLAVWGVGLPLGIALWAGLAFTILRLGRRNKAELLLLSWALPYFLITGGFHAKFLRYLLPLTPALAIMAAHLLLSWLGWAREHHRWAIKLVIGVILAGAVLYSLAYLGIYSQPHPSLRASQWVRDNVPQGSQIVRESSWDESLPYLEGYQDSVLELYDTDNESKVKRMAFLLAQGDYLVVWSNRFYGTIPRIPERYPITSRYHQRLFSGDLGYRLVYSATSYPSLLGVSLVDDTFRRPGLPQPQWLDPYLPGGAVINAGYADESFTVYDHPKVMVFQNQARLPTERLEMLLLEEGPASTPSQGMMSPEDRRANREGGTWSALFSPGSLANRLPFLTWLALVEAISLAALPLALVVFRPLADRGYLLAKALGILLVGYLTWLLASLRILPFSQGSVFLSLAALALASSYLLARHKADMLSFLRARWRLLLAGEALFLTALLLFYLLRLWNPDLWHPFRGGEKPMDFAYLNAVVKSSYMPPYDPWFSGGFINYYYFGQFLLATLIKATGVLPEVAFNLGVPLFFALTVAGAFSIVYNLVRAARGQEGGARSAIVAGIAGAALVAILGNLGGAIQLGNRLWLYLAQGARPLLPDDFYWGPSRMMGPQTGATPGLEITEFPYFTFLFADPHAHLFALPFTLLAIGLALPLVLNPPPFHGRAEASGILASWKAHLDRHHLLLLLLISLTVGGLRLINSWDFPTYFLLAGAALFLLEYSRSRSFGARVLFWTALQMGLVYILSLLLYLPYHQNYQLYYRWVEASQWRTPFSRYLAIHGLFLFIIVSFLLREAWRRWHPGAFSWREAIRKLRRPQLRKWQWPFYIALAFVVFFSPEIVLALAAALFALGLGTVAFLSLLLALALPLAWSYLRKGEAVPLFALGLAVLGLALTLGVDFLVLEGDINRQNTVFKFYLQAWVLLALASAYWLGRLAGDAWLHLKAGRYRLPWGLWAGALGLLLLASLVYPIAATPARARDRFQPLPLTNDGMAYMAQAVYRDQNGPIVLGWDLLAIDWLRENVPGSPVIAEGVTPLYRWGSRVSIYTGLPTIVGWQWHQEQQRAGYAWAVGARAREVNQLFSDASPQAALRLLRKYDVSYIYVGQLERLYYPQGGLAKFDDMVGQYLELVYPGPGAENPDVKIYRVRQETLRFSPDL